jgi:hypothetical protein
MFSFLVEEAPTTHVDLDLIQDFAKQAASAYLGHGQIPLNQTISKIASVEKLNPDQVGLVCQEANKLVHTQLFKTAEDKYTEFELAKPEEIVSSLEGAEKTASISVDDYAIRPNENFNEFSITKTAGHNGLYIPESVKKKATLEKLAFEQQQIEDAYIQKNTELKELERKFVKIARDELTPYRIDERRKHFSALASFCKSAGVSEDTTKRLMGLLDTVMVRQGLLEKTADVKADPELISDNLDARIINGNHPLYIVVKTIPEVEDKKKLYQERYNWIQEQVQGYNADGAILRQEAKGL